MFMRFVSLDHVALSDIRPFLPQTPSPNGAELRKSGLASPFCFPVWCACHFKVRPPSIHVQGSMTYARICNFLRHLTSLPS
jgi:hypothetical protein